ncbi:hypothetical protein BDR26DRAFT_868692 [Obelidium mucronatum]|nr:hypothetical protein BDR26DRAFT_868692 [Obelidium mucronatum]
MTLTAAALRAPPFTAAEAAAAFARAKRSQNGNAVSVAKTFYYETYRRMLASTGALCVVQNNNLSAAEFKGLKAALAAHGLVATQVRNSVFAAAARDELPKNVDVKRLRRLFVGPSLVVFSSSSVSAEENTLATLTRALATNNKDKDKKLLVAGALLERVHVLSADQAAKVAALPPKSSLRAELVGLLSAPAANLSSLLATQPQTLVRTLAARSESD